MMDLPFDSKKLWSLSPGDYCNVVGFDDAMPESYRVRLMELGFYPGELIECLVNPGLGAPRVYRVNNTVFSLDEEIACRVFVNLTSVGLQGEILL